MTRETLCSVLEKEGLAATTARRIVDGFFQALSGSICAGDEPGIKNFVKFTTRMKQAAEFVNNRSKQRMTVPQHRVVQARFAKSFKGMFDLEEGKRDPARTSG